MNAKDLLKIVQQLPPDRQAEIFDFIEFVAQRAGTATAPPNSKPIREEPFIGMWAARKDMADSRDWVRALREKEWGG